MVFAKLIMLFNLFINLSTFYTRNADLFFFFKKFKVNMNGGKSRIRVVEYKYRYGFINRTC